MSVGALFLGLGDSNLVCLVYLSPVFSYYRCYKPKDARVPILIIEVQVRPVKIVQYPLNFTFQGAAAKLLHFSCVVCQVLAFFVFTF